MSGRELLENQWPYLLSFLPPGLDLERTARETGALARRRNVSDASVLLRLALAYGFCGLSLRQVAAWAQAQQIASLSNVALLKRLRASHTWLGMILGAKLAESAPPPPDNCRQLRLRLVDATTISAPGSEGTDWRLHVGFDLRRLAIDHIELTDASGGETLTRFTFGPGELVIGDRGYAHRRGIASVMATGAYFLVRLNWQNVPLQHADGSPFDLLAALRSLPDATALEFAVQTAPSPRDALPVVPGRLIALRKSEAAAAAARRKVLRERSRQGRSVDPRSLEAAGYVFVLTSLPSDMLDATAVLQLYRFRWQIELAFKRLKSLVHLDALPAGDPGLARTFIYAKLIAALMLDDFTDRFLAISPWGYRFP